MSNHEAERLCIAACPFSFEAQELAQVDALSVQAGRGEGALFVTRLSHAHFHTIRVPSRRENASQNQVLLVVSCCLEHHGLDDVAVGGALERRSLSFDLAFDSRDLLCVLPLCLLEQCDQLFGGVVDAHQLEPVDGADELDVAGHGRVLLVLEQSVCAVRSDDQVAEVPPCRIPLGDQGSILFSSVHPHLADLLFAAGRAQCVD